MKSPREAMEFSEKCPFCPGNEEQTPDATCIIQKDGRWQVRSVPNRFSAFSLTGGRERSSNGVYRTMNGVGIHEVIIESPIHNHHYTTMPVSHIRMVIEAYKERFNACLKDPRIEAVIIFKNYGQSAGSSLCHPHSQLIAMPLVPAHIRNSLSAAKDYFDDMGSCVYCDMLNQELSEKVRIVAENESFVAFCPYASGTAFESWIMPRRHEPSFGEINETEMDHLALMMKDLFCRYYHGLKDPDFNFSIKTPPRDESNDRSYHWYVEILPKLTKRAGFELGSGMLINITLPEKNAELLRNAEIPQPAAP